jgi:hypothetical protein
MLKPLATAVAMVTTMSCISRQAGGKADRPAEGGRVEASPTRLKFLDNP